MLPDVRFLRGLRWQLLVGVLRDATNRSNPVAGEAMPEAGILLIEDEATSREILQYALSEAGYPLDVAATAAAALTQLSSTRYVS